MTETLAAALSHFEEFELIDPGGASGVIAAVGAIEAGQQLGVTYVLEGSLQLAPGKARIGVQLIDAESGRRVWSETLDHGLHDVFALQDDITAIIASTVGEALHVEQAQKISQKTIAELTNYELMVRGLQHLHRINYEDNQIARNLFEQVRIREPEQYFPILCFVWTYAIELQYGWPSSEVDALDRCRDLTHQLLKIVNYIITHPYCYLSF